MGGRELAYSALPVSRSEGGEDGAAMRAVELSAIASVQLPLLHSLQRHLLHLHPRHAGLVRRRSLPSVVADGVHRSQ